MEILHMSHVIFNAYFVIFLASCLLRLNPVPLINTGVPSLTGLYGEEQEARQLSHSDDAVLAENVQQGELPVDQVRGQVPDGHLHTPQHSRHHVPGGGKQRRSDKAAPRWDVFGSSLPSVCVWGGGG